MQNLAAIGQTVPALALGGKLGWCWAHPLDTGAFLTHRNRSLPANFTTANLVVLGQTVGK